MYKRERFGDDYPKNNIAYQTTQQYARTYRLAHVKFHVFHNLHIVINPSACVQYRGAGLSTDMFTCHCNCHHRRLCLTLSRVHFFQIARLLSLMAMCHQIVTGHRQISMPWPLTSCHKWPAQRTRCFRVKKALHITEKLTCWLSTICLKWLVLVLAHLYHLKKITAII